MRELYQDRLFSDHMNHPSVVSVGIDVGKAKLDVACVREDRTSIHQVFINTEKGIASLARLLKQQRTAVTVPCVLEATGDYHLLAALMLSKGGYAVKCINPLITKKYCRASVRDAKSDKIDSKRLAEIGLIEEHLPAFADTKDAIAARKLLSSIAHLERVRQQLMGHLQVLEETGKALGIRDGHRDTERALLCNGRSKRTVPGCALPRHKKQRHSPTRCPAYHMNKRLYCSLHSVTRYSRIAISLWHLSASMCVCVRAASGRENRFSRSGAMATCEKFCSKSVGVSRCITKNIDARI
jgi:Transposase